MKTILYPEKETWQKLSGRPVIGRSQLDDVVRTILHRVRLEGDKALLEYSQKFDGISLPSLKVSPSEIREAVDLVPGTLKSAIRIAKKNIEKFHSMQLISEPRLEITEGVKCWRRSVAIEKVGLYIPGGSAPLFSTVLMLAIPAKIAGCREIVMSTPPGSDGKVNPLILYTAWLTGVTDIFKIGGAQAIAAMAFGTESVPGVYKIFGPGNQFVTRAKEMVQMEGVSIDLPAGPSEVLVIADRTANPAFIASDLLSQAEHSADSQVIFLTDNREVLESVKSEVDVQVLRLQRKTIACKALENSMVILLSSVDECMDFSNLYAPEHLIINTLEAEKLSEKVVNAGSVFLGQYSCESAGDYASGTNHTLPTNGFAKSFSGVSVESFLRKISFQEVSRKGIENLGPVIQSLAEAELLEGHKKAVEIRLKNGENV